jgi:hypothetical protein
MQLTEYQRAQLLHKHLTGDFVFFNDKKNKVSRLAFTKMLDALIENNLIDKRSAKVTAKGKAYCDEHHREIDISILHTSVQK